MELDMLHSLDYSIHVTNSNAPHLGTSAARRLLLPAVFWPELEVHSAAGWHSAAGHGWLGLLGDERGGRQDHASHGHSVFDG